MEKKEKNRRNKLSEMSESGITYELLKSNRGTAKLHIDGYTYEKNRSTFNNFYWYCEERRKLQCKATVITTNSEDHNLIVTRKPTEHNHPIDPVRKHLAEFKDKLKEGVAAGIDTLDLINESQADVPFDIIEHLPSDSALRQLIYRRKRKEKNSNFEKIFVGANQSKDGNSQANNQSMRIKNVNLTQMRALLDLLSEDGVMVDGRVTYSNTTKLDFWKRVASHLNSIKNGASKNAWQWCKVWTDWKNRTQKKANIVLKRKSYNLLGQPININMGTIEMRLLRLIGYPLDEKEDMMQLEMTTKTEATDIEDQLDEYRVDELMLHSKEDVTTSDKEDNIMSDNEDNLSEKEDEFNIEDNLYVEDDNNDDDDDGMVEFNIKPESEDSDDNRKRRKSSRSRVSGHKAKKKKVSLEDYRLKAQIELQRERQEQKKEELRLRAIELKLKGDELRLKEMEMNKVKYLTNIEEEKLKCFREISSSLKELLEISRNGNLRLHNVI